MPLYEYACEKCHHSFETLVFEGDTVECPECRSQKLQRLLSLPQAGHSTSAASSGCGDMSLPPCGAPWCQRKG